MISSGNSGAYFKRQLLGAILCLVLLVPEALCCCALSFPCESGQPTTSSENERSCCQEKPAAPQNKDRAYGNACDCQTHLITDNARKNESRPELKTSPFATLDLIPRAEVHAIAASPFRGGLFDLRADRVPKKIWPFKTTVELLI
ncbi:MAG: hypothetical protein NUW37_13440 [Planctomycetes bacterium]|nr:hypothetical protein [Planctomycetota bacterium]